MDKLTNIAPLAGRILMAIIFLASGIAKVGDPAGTAGYMSSVGVPGALAWPAAIFELALAASLILGYQVRIMALLGAGFSLLSGLLFHLNLGDQMQTIMLMKNLAIAGGFLYVFAYGAGAYALDKR